MIKLDIFDPINESATDSEFIQEGIKDMLDDAEDFASKSPDEGGLGVDVDGYKKQWDNSDTAGKITTAGQATADVAGKLDNKLKSIENNYGVDGRSIVARARNSILQFPVYITTTNRVNEAHIITKMFEKVYASFIQSVISQNPILSKEEANNLVFLKGYHTNIRESAYNMNEFYNPIDDIDEMMQESVYCERKLSDRCTVKFSVIPSSFSNDLVLENARLMHEPLEGFSYLYYEDSNASPLTMQSQSSQGNYVDLTVKDFEDMAKVKMSQDEVDHLTIRDDEINDIGRRTFPMPPKPDKNAPQAEWDQYKIKRDETAQKYLDFTENEKRKRDQARAKLTQEIETIKDDIRSGKYNKPDTGNMFYDSNTKRYYRKLVRTTTTFGKDRELPPEKPSSTPINPGPRVPELLRSSDIKKLNGLDPYLIRISFYIDDPANGVKNEVNYIVGIKCVMHLVYAQDLGDELYELVTGNVKKLQKVRYKTGEINFMNYMFNIKGLKADAAKNINYNKKWITTLKRLASYKKANGSLLKEPIELLTGDVPIPNGTLVLSQADVTILVNRTGIDLSQVSNAKRLMGSLFLMAVVIIDSSDGSMRVLFDKDNDWDVQSLASIDAEVAKTDNSQMMRELQKAVNNR